MNPRMLPPMQKVMKGYLIRTLTCSRELARFPFAPSRGKQGSATGFFTSGFHGLRDAQGSVASPVATFSGPAGAEDDERTSSCLALGRGQITRIDHTNRAYE